MRTLAAAMLAALLAGSSSCLDDSPSAPTWAGVSLAISAQIDPGPDGRVVAVYAYYHRISEDRIDLPVSPRYFAVPRGQSRTERVIVSIGGCLTDAQRMRGQGQSGCRFFVELQLLDENGEFISGQTHEAEASAPGQTVNVPPFNLPQAAIAISSSSVAFEAIEMDPIPAQAVVGFWSETGASLGAITVEIEYPARSSSPWLTHTLSEGSLILRPTTTDASPGTYTALVRLTASREGVAPREIEVTYTVLLAPGGGDFVMFGDGNFIDATAMATPGNRRLVQRLAGYRNDGPRGSGADVQIDCGRQSTIGYLCNGGLAGFIGALADVGVTSTVISSSAGTLTSVPAGVKLIVLLMPCQAFGVQEVNALKQFAAEGGRIALFSEFEGFGAGWQTCAAVHNQLARALESGITLNGGQFDCGQHFTLPATSLRSHQITLGLTEVTMGCSSSLSADKTARELIFDPSNEVLFAAVGPVNTLPISPAALLPVDGTLNATDAPRPLLVPSTDTASPGSNGLGLPSMEVPRTGRRGIRR